MCADTHKYIKTKEETILQQVKLNHSAPQPPQMVRAGYIEIDRRRIIVLDSLLSSLPKGVFRLELSVKENQFLKIRDVKKVLQISVNGQCSNRIDQLKITSHRTDYAILFFPDEVIDCQVVQTDNPEDDVFQLEYELNLYNVKDDKEPWDTISSKIDVCFEPFGLVEPIVTFIPKQESVDYRKVDDLEVGVLRVYNGGGFYRAPALDVSFGISASIRGRSVPGLVTLGQVARSHYGRPVLNPLSRSRQSESNVAAGGNCDRFEDDLGGRKKILGLCVNPVKDSKGDLQQHCYDVPVVLHLNDNTLSNPYADEKIVFTVSYRSKPNYNRSQPLSQMTEKVVEAGQIALLKNKQLMALDVQVGDESVDYHLKKGDRHLFNAEFFGWNSDGTESRIPYHLIIRNTAEESDSSSPGAGIYITNFQIGPPVPQDGFRIQFKGDDKEEGLLFDIDSAPSDFVLFSGGKSHRLNISYTDANIDKMFQGSNEVYSMEVMIPVTFNYYLDRDGACQQGVPVPTEADEFSAHILFRLFKRALPQWLCVDFGTSAIVASYSDSIEDSERLLPLKRKKSILYQETWPDNAGAWEDIAEGDDHLVSSAIVLQDINLGASLAGDPSAYGHCAVMLSPPSVGYAEYYLRLLPCLKSLVGNKNLPYELIPSGVRRQLPSRNARISVEDIVRLVYRQFFNRFLASDPSDPEDPDVRGTHRLVLSFPNTFTPVQIEQVKEIARDTLPNLRPDYLRFISESDAVAFYYNSHREEFIRNSGNLLDGRQDTFDKNVLVFDMGAGTLDLTYFTREIVPNARGTSSIRITIRGKLGLSKAGNYLDYVLASIIVDRLCNNAELQDEQMQSLLKGLISLEEKNLASLSAASALKRYVKDSVKPLLNEPADTCLEDDLVISGIRISQVTGIKVGDIVNDSLYSNFMNSVSRDVFEHFVYLFGSGQGSRRSIPLDMVVFSGRMTGLLHIRTAVKDSLDVLTGGGVDCLFADLSTKKLITDVTEPVRDVTGLKTAVVDGALAFCLGYHSFELVNQNVYATYGVILKMTGGGASWLPLIDYRTEGTLPASVSRDGILVQEYDSRIHSSHEHTDVMADSIDIQSVAEIILVQSFSKDTLADWNAGRKELISVLGSARMDIHQYLAGPVRIYLLIDSKNQMKLYVGATCWMLSPREDYRNESFAKSMWPVRRGR